MNKYHEYLGDAVYASFDGFHIWLHLNSHDSRPLIALDQEVLERLVYYAARISERQREQQATGARERQRNADDMGVPPS